MTNRKLYDIEDEYDEFSESDEVLLWIKEYVYVLHSIEYILCKSN